MRHIRQSASSLGWRVYTCLCVYDFCVFMYVYYVLINGWHLPPRKGVKEHRSHKHYRGITYLNIIYFGGVQVHKNTTARNNPQQSHIHTHSGARERSQQNNGGKQQYVFVCVATFRNRHLCVDCMIISFREICSIQLRNDSVNVEVESRNWWINDANNNKNYTRPQENKLPNVRTDETNGW